MNSAVAPPACHTAAGSACTYSLSTGPNASPKSRPKAKSRTSASDCAPRRTAALSAMSGTNAPMKSRRTRPPEMSRPIHAPSAKKRIVTATSPIVWPKTARASASAGRATWVSRGTERSVAMGRASHAGPAATTASGVGSGRDPDATRERRVEDAGRVEAAVDLEPGVPARVARADALRAQAVDLAPVRADAEVGEALLVAAEQVEPAGRPIDEDELDHHRRAVVHHRSERRRRRDEAQRDRRRVVRAAQAAPGLRGDGQDLVDGRDVRAVVEADAELHRDRRQLVGLPDVEDAVGDARVAVVAHVAQGGLEAPGHERGGVARESPQDDAGDRQRGLELGEGVALELVRGQLGRLAAVLPARDEDRVASVAPRVGVEEQLVVVALAEDAVGGELVADLLPRAQRADLVEPELLAHLDDERVDDPHAAHPADRGRERVVVLHEPARVAVNGRKRLGVRRPGRGLDAQDLAAAHDEVE